MKNEKIRLNRELLSLKENADKNDIMRRNASAINAGNMSLATDKSFDESLIKKLDNIEKSLKKEASYPSYPQLP